MISLVPIVLVALILGVFAGDASAQWKLKKCPEDQLEQWHNCFGARKDARGVTYVGAFKNGKPHGKGTLTMADGATHVGTFTDGQANGQGTRTFPDGAEYVGAFKNHVFHGQGTLTYPSGNKYVGAFEQNKINGRGTIFIAETGNKLVGTFKNGIIQGQGTYLFAGGDKYVGVFKNSRFNGQGTYFRADGSKYVGAFKDHNFHGRGVSYAPDGSIMEQGIYENGRLIKSEQVVQQQQVAKVEPQQQAASASSTPVLTAERKVALVIGNQAYKHAVPLANPKNDATKMSAMLKRLGFDVVFGTDLRKREMEQQVRKFVRKSREADLSLFFYAGHGIQVAGQNYLMPVDAKVKDETALDFELFNVSKVSNYMGGSGRVGIILLDACRDNPLSRTLARSLGTRSAQVGRGLARISTPRGGLLVGFATSPGDVAADGQGENSPFTAALLKHLPTPGVEIELLMKRVKAQVIRMTKNDQRPWHNSDLAKEVYLAQAR
ncbi:MAG: caspase family protein [Pseudomonadota bacterium]